MSRHQIQVMLIKAVCIALAVAFVAWGFLVLGGLRARPVYCIGLAVAIAVLVVCTQLVLAPGEPYSGEREPTTAGQQPYADLYFLEYRLSWGSVERARFEQRVRPLLVRVADERLRQRHGVDYTTDERKARGIVGEDLWQLMTRESISEGKPPTHREVTALVTAIEHI
ncbi:MAG TPA: hypothetical protein VHX59_01220 [Mycobacteriales bacterium]|nr:hypothetical protein [Mycobacteriales bacterium]